MNWNKKTLLERIVDRWKEKDNDYSRINANRDSITRYFRSDELVETDDKGELLGQEIYNGSGPWFSRMMATGFQGSLVSKNIAWIRYQMQQFELKGIDELDIWLQDIKDHMADVYQRSNFYDVQPQFTLGGITTGSPVMFGEEDINEQKTMWMPQHYKTIRLYYDKYNRVEGAISKEDTWTAKQIFDFFIKTDDENGTKRKAKLPVSVNTALTGGMLEDTFVVFRATFKVIDPIWDGDGFKKPTNDDYKWLSVYILELAEGDKRDVPLNDNMGYFSQPFAVWDFDKKPWESSSRTPAWYAIWDCLGLQQIDKNYLEDIQNINRPAAIMLQSMENRAQLGPEGEMYVSKAEYDSPPKFLRDKVGGIDLSKDLIELKTDALKRWFYGDKWEMFSDLKRRSKQPETATWTWQMAGEKATLLSPAIETHSKYLETTDARVVDVEVQAGRGPFDRQRLENITDIVLSNAKGPVRSIGVRPVFIGRLAQAQKVSQELEPIQRTMEAVTPLMEIFPSLRFMYREYETANDINEAFDFPQKNIIPKEEYDEKVAADAQARAQEKQQLMAIEMAKASKSVSGKVEPDSILGAAVGAAG